MIVLDLRTALVDYGPAFQDVIIDFVSDTIRCRKMPSILSIVMERLMGKLGSLRILGVRGLIVVVLVWHGVPCLG